jgi:cell division protein FtsB
MNRDETHDEYEEVESPFAPTKSARLRTRKNVFNRPFAAEASVAPAVFETSSTRKSIGHADNSELIQRRSSDLASTEIDYLDEDGEEEEVQERRPARSTPKKAAKPRKNVLAKIGWAVVGMLVLRLICMDRGVWDYFSTESDIREKQRELKSIHTENKELRTEITRIQSDKNYQRQLSKEHLGVIAADEFLILFAGEAPEDSETSERSL